MNTSRFIRSPAGLGYHRILVPLTLSASSRATLAIARNLVRESGARLVLLHVVDLNITGEERGIPRSRLVNQRRHEAELELGRLAYALSEDTDCEVVVDVGRPAKVILETARNKCVDAIVLSTHGCRGWLKRLHRNTAEAVVHQRPCAVWLISPGHSEDALNVMIVDGASPADPAKHWSKHENPSPFRSLVRVLLS